MIPAAGIIACLGALSAYTFVLIGRSCSDSKAESYEQSWARTVGRKSAWLPAGACVATCFAGCLAYTLIIGDSFSALAKTFGAPAVVANRSNIILAVSATVLLPLSLLKSESCVVGFFLFERRQRSHDVMFMFPHDDGRLREKKTLALILAPPATVQGIERRVDRGVLGS